MAKRLLNLILVLFILPILYSCSFTPEEIEMLDKSVRSYERAIRWGDFVRAKSFHKSDPTLHDIERRRLKLYRVSGYSIIHNDTPDLENAYMLIEIKYYKNDRPVIKTMTIQQNWKRDKKINLWYVDTPFPKFR